MNTGAAYNYTGAAYIYAGALEDESKQKPKAPPKSTAVAPRIDATKYEYGGREFHISTQILIILILFLFSYKHMSGSSQYKFGVLAKIVKHLKTLHQDGADHALTLEEILDETNQLDVGMKISQVF